MYQISDAQLSRIFNLSTSPKSMAPPSPGWPSSTTIWSTTSTAASQSITSLSCKSQICCLKFYDVTCLPLNFNCKLISLLVINFWGVVLFYCQQTFVPGFESHFIYFFWYQSVSEVCVTVKRFPSWCQNFLSSFVKTAKLQYSLRGY